MKTLIVIVGAAGREDVSDVRYLRSFDPEAQHGRGEIRTTTFRELALRFDGLTAAWECWQTQSKSVPLRNDGRPNKPLTAYTVTFDTTED
jgi:hypothetical protein